MHAPVAAKAASLAAARSHPLTWRTVLKRALVVAAAGVAIYLVLPSLTEVLASWPRLSTLEPAWTAAAVAAELASFTCYFALQRLALQTRSWFAVVTAGLAGNAVTGTVPGGGAAGAAVQFEMLATAGFDADTAVAGLTAFSLLNVGALLGLPILALPAMLAGAPASPGLVHTAFVGVAGFCLVEASLGGLLILAGVHAGDAFLATLLYRLASYWLPLLAGPPAYLLFRHRYGGVARRPASGGGFGEQAGPGGRKRPVKECG